jgi:hypothetical protein
VHVDPAGRAAQLHIEVLVKVISVDIGHAYRSGRRKRTVTVRVALGSSPDETMRITVAVPEDADEELARELGLARASDFARRFSDLSSSELLHTQKSRLLA